MVETVLGMTDLQIKLITAAGQLALAGTVAYVAWQQWRTARNKLKADLYDRRYALYVKFRGQLETALLKQDPVTLGSATATATEMRWLFGNEVADHVEKNVLPSANSFMQARASLEYPDPLRDRAALQDAYLKSMENAFGNLNRTLQLLTPHLTLAH
ncbi:hypothetical protein [Stenotrophomonas lactitubi]|uniref:hypothetical protein n=1 Tax=Stenotrophomonas lactitubi TaxID=2045214 RepID=UPI0028A2D6CF|nr:hypothetical protein [Stenotrophomonas lactitubi]